MVKTHRSLFERLSAPTFAAAPGEGASRLAPVTAAVLDTPYGFQPNADEISRRAVRYFHDSIGARTEVVSLRGPQAAGSLAVETSIARLVEADWVFSGPGSPTYALRQWRASPVPAVLADKLWSGGCVVFSSAAALTLGRWTVPVYEIYKSGEDPHWVEGLDLLGPFGLEVAVVPHYDNAEGGTHDTRYCYLGEDRLGAMEEHLPSQGWVLGVDEHTACVLDLEEGNVHVTGVGGVTLRRQGTSEVLPSGTTVRLDDLARLARGLEARTGRGTLSGPQATPGRGPGALGGPRQASPNPGPLGSEVARLASLFDDALARRQAAEAAEAALDLEETLHRWSDETFSADEMDRARAALRQVLVRMGEVCERGLQDPRDSIGPFVEALLSERDRARSDGRYADADRIRDALGAAGAEVRDTRDGTQWHLAGGT